MQRAYATSLQATKLLAEAEILMGSIRQNDAAMPANGTVTAVTLGTPQSLDVLTAPRQCEMHVTGHDPYMVNLTPRADATIQTVVSEALGTHAAPSAQPASKPKPGQGL